MARSPGLNLCCLFFNDEPSPSEILGILAFDATKTMCRLVSIYNSLSETEIHKLRRHVIKSKGVAHLNSRDKCFLLNLACAEFLEELNFIADAVSRLGRRCSDKELTRFDAVYADMKNGVVDLKKLEFGTRNVERIIEKMEKLVSATRSLHTAMESLTEMEASEKKMQRWRTIRTNNGVKVKVECFNDRIEFHRRQMQYFKQISLWNMTFDKVVGMMSRIISIVYERIYLVFGSLVTGVPGRNKSNVVRGYFGPKNLENCCCRIEHRELYKINLCLVDQDEESLKKRGRNLGHVLKNNKMGVIRLPDGGGGVCGEVVKNSKVLRLAPPSTVGGSGLSQRYANVILFMDRCVRATAAIGKDARTVLYEMLPGRLKVKLRAKLRGQWLKWEENLKRGEEGKSEVAERWNEAVEEVMDWLLPMALDTVRWQAERNLEKQRFDTKPTVLLLQTLFYSDLEKVEEAIVEVLVGLSHIHWYQKQL